VGRSLKERWQGGCCSHQIDPRSIVACCHSALPHAVLRRHHQESLILILLNHELHTSHLSLAVLE
jgi:hypothetical protein